MIEIVSKYFLYTLVWLEKYTHVTPNFIFVFFIPLKLLEQLLKTLPNKILILGLSYYSEITFMSVLQITVKLWYDQIIVLGCCVFTLPTR